MNTCIVTYSSNKEGTDDSYHGLWTMTEVSDWWYKYFIEQYKNAEKYLITVDWWVVMWANRYQCN